MTLSPDYLGDEQPRMEVLVEATELRTRRANVDGDADDLDLPRRTRMRKLTKGRIEEDGIKQIDRFFQIRPVEPSTFRFNRPTISPYHDVEARYEILLGFRVGGGRDGRADAVDQAALEDCGLVRQKLMHPLNRGVRTVSIGVDEPSKVLDEVETNGGRQVWRMVITSWIRVDTEAA